MNEPNLELLATAWGYTDARDPEFIEIVASQIIIEGLERYFHEIRKEN